VKTTEKLERAYVRDAISAAEYEPACEKLIGQFRTLWGTLRDTVREGESVVRGDARCLCVLAVLRPCLVRYPRQRGVPMKAARGRGKCGGKRET
jgi:hypothetical protein